MQGLHSANQKFNTTTFPFKLSEEYLFPAKSVKSNGSNGVAILMLLFCFTDAGVFSKIIVPLLESVSFVLLPVVGNPIVGITLAEGATEVETGIEGVVSFFVSKITGGSFNNN